MGVKLVCTYSGEKDKDIALWSEEQQTDYYIRLFRREVQLFIDGSICSILTYTSCN
jgi:hypothetical protein